MAGAGVAQMAEIRAMQGSSVIFAADGAEQGDAVCVDKAQVACAQDAMGNGALWIGDIV